jgi:hypothetical protein
MSIQIDKYTSQMSIGFSVVWCEGGHWHIIFEICCFWIQFTFDKPDKK